MENAALVTKGNVDLVYEVTENAPRKLSLPAGLQKARSGRQTFDPMSRIPVKVPKVKEATALGAAITAGIGVGIYSNLSEAAKALVKWDAEYYPNIENTKTYDQIYANWRKVYKESLELSNQKLTTPIVDGTWLITYQ